MCDLSEEHSRQREKKCRGSEDSRVSGVTEGTLGAKRLEWPQQGGELWEVNSERWPGPHSDPCRALQEFFFMICLLLFKKVYAVSCTSENGDIQNVPLSLLELEKLVFSETQRFDQSHLAGERQNWGFCLFQTKLRP